jgi:catecholate siderophore receptor
LRQTILRLLLGSGGTLLAAPQLLGAEIEEILVEERQRDSYSLDESTLSKFTEPLRDTPQTITTLSEQLLDDRAAMSLNDALRNVPGITLGAGEFSWQGNNPNIRGFSSRNDMFLDGMRDFGSYDRDPFNLQSLEVMQGPSSMVFGRGSTGGVINQASKVPLPEPLRALHVNIGNADTRRATLDVNQPLTDTMAVRVNLLQHEGGVPERDGAAADRYGIAPSLSLELGSATALTLSYMKQHSENTPDYGLPWLAGKPADVDRANYYGFATDFIDTDADISTVRVDHQFSADTKMQALVRYADYDRHTRITEPLLVGSPTAATPLEDIRVNRNVFRGESKERMLLTQVNLTSSFMTGPLEHALVTGIEVGKESSAPGFGFGLGVPDTPLLAPVEEPFSSTGIAYRLLSDTDADSLAGFVLDTIKFGEHWQLLSGLRWDRFAINYRAERYFDNNTVRSSEQVLRTDIKTSYRAALVYKPVTEGTIYLGWGTSFNPSSEGLSFVNSGRNLTIGDAYLGPENNRSVELGTKWELFSSALDLEAALFHIAKSNARVPDPANPGFNILAGEQTVTGLSLTVTGRLSQALSVNGGYTWLDSEQARTTQLTVLPGTPLQNVPEHAYSFWLNYAAGNRLQVAGGARYVDERLATVAQPVKAVPDYWALDAMVKYEATENLSFKLNFTNLTDEYYFDQLHPFHVIPGPGFTSVFAINLDY